MDQKVAYQGSLVEVLGISPDGGTACIEFVHLEGHSHVPAGELQPA